MLLYYLIAEEQVIIEISSRFNCQEAAYHDSFSKN